MVDFESKPAEKDRKMKKPKKRVLEESNDNEPKAKFKKNDKKKFEKPTNKSTKKFDKKADLTKEIKDKKNSFKKTNYKEKKPFEKLDKKQTRDKQKKDKEERKTKKLNSDVYTLGTQAKMIWEEVRKEDCPDEKKNKLTKELHKLVKGNIKKIIFAHDTVRVVECLMALGSQEIKDALYEELKDDILEMAKSKYANFFVQKLLR